MGKHKGGSHSSKPPHRTNATSGKKTDKVKEDVPEKKDLCSVIFPVFVLFIAILAGSGYFLYSRGPQHLEVKEKTPYKVTGNVSVITLPSPAADFAQACAKRGVPVVLRNSVVTGWKASKLWTPGYLQTKITRLSGIYENSNRWFGPYFDKTKPLTGSAVRLNKYKTDLTLSSSEFFNRIQNPVRGRHLYFTGGIEQLGAWAEEHIQPLGELLSLNPSRSSVNAWIGQPHVIAHCHYDGYHNFYTQLYGTKKFTLFRPTNWPGLYPYPFLHPSHAQAQVNASEREESGQLYPLVKEVEAVEVVLEPGDLLYMPPLWFHQVESMSVSISVNVWTDSRQTELVEKMFSVPNPLANEKIAWPSGKARAVATSLLIYRILESICKYQVCTDIHTDKFVERDIDDVRERELSDKVLYFVHRLWSTRYRTLMQKKQLPERLSNGVSILCEHSSEAEVDREAVQEAEHVLEGARFGVYVMEMAELARGLPRDTWELWVGNFVEYLVLAGGAVEDVKYVGLYLQAFSSCIVKYVSTQ